MSEMENKLKKSNIQTTIPGTFHGCIVLSDGGDGYSISFFGDERKHLHKPHVHVGKSGVKIATLGLSRDSQEVPISERQAKESKKDKKRIDCAAEYVQKYREQFLRLWDDIVVEQKPVANLNKHFFSEDLMARNPPKN